MKDICKYLSALLLIAFSFFYTDKINSLLIYKSELMKQIIENKDSYEVKSCNALIDGDYIIPGINGKTVSEVDSFYNMKEDKLVFKSLIPEISVNNNKNKIIKKGNSRKESVSIIVTDNNDIINYAQANNISLTRLINKSNLDKNSYFEQINYDTKYYAEVDKLLSRYELNTNICFNKFNNCKDKYLVMPTITLTSTNVNYDPSAGDIILLDETYDLSKFIRLIQKIKYRNLNIIFLSKLISESI